MIRSDVAAAIRIEPYRDDWPRLFSLERAVEAMMPELRGTYGVRSLQAVLKEDNFRSHRLLVRRGFSRVARESGLRGLEPGEILMERKLSGDIVANP